MHADHPDAPHHKELKAFQRRRGVNHMQIFLEQLVSEILETSSGANHSIKKLHNGPVPTPPPTPHPSPRTAALLDATAAIAAGCGHAF